eukprot:TRINITY_DN32776_c0_g1_i1.p1 TRINITY_DN32776_c0_g1~~TRINITY_DN32776_c0_g1_i1.p1  ORF type:complete len:881 (-),score=149.36 TRINITY_DN32776_c0_g1_i1:62-2704(-)
MLLCSDLGDANRRIWFSIPLGFAYLACLTLSRFDGRTELVPCRAFEERESDLVTLRSSLDQPPAMPILPTPACLAGIPHQASSLGHGGTGSPSSCPASGKASVTNLYEAWVRNPLICNLIRYPSTAGSAVRALQLLPHIMEPMLMNASNTSCETFTIQEICIARAGLFNSLQKIYPSARSNKLGQALKLLITFPRYLIKALLAKHSRRSFIWSTWWFESKLPLLSSALPHEAKLVNEEFLLDPRIRSIQPLFRGCHQLVELACFFGVDLTKEAAGFLDTGLKVEAAGKMIDCSRLLHTMSQFLNILAQLDTLGYQEYRPSLKGTSGGDSINLRLLTRMCRAFQVDGDELAMEPDDISGRSGSMLTNAVHSLQYGLGLFWSAHLALAVTSNGLDQTGTAGTSIRQMFVHLEGVLNTRFCQWLPKYAAGCPSNSRWVDACGSPKEVGEAIFESCRFLEITAPPPAPLICQPDKLFEDCWGADFRSQSMAPPLKTSIVDLPELHKEHVMRLDLEHYYMKVQPDLEATLLELLHLDRQRTSVNCASNLSELMFRILVGLQQLEERKTSQSYHQQAGPIVVSCSYDFLSFRTAWRTLETWGWSREEVPMLSDSVNLAQPILAALTKHGKKVKLVHITLVSSVTQLAMTPEELKAILKAAREAKAVVLLDACQAFCNIEYDFGQIVDGALGDVFILGSCVKHARSLEGVGWCAFDPCNSIQKLLPSGWCANLSVLNFPMHDPGMPEPRECLTGGTVANAVHAEFFVKQQRYLLDSGISVAAIGRRVQSLHQLFLARLAANDAGLCRAGQVVGWKRRQAQPAAQSKVLVLDCSQGHLAADLLAVRLQEHGFRVDARHGRYLRLGFDLCHSEANVAALADAILCLLDS